MTVVSDADLCAVIADPSRRHVIDLLVDQGEASAWSLAHHVRFSRQAVCKHMTVLERTGLVSRRKAGREVLYKIEPERLHEATRAMVELATQWDRRLDSIKRLAEAAHAAANVRSRIATEEG